MKLHRIIMPYKIEVHDGKLNLINKNGNLIKKEIEVKGLGQKKLRNLAYGSDGVIRNVKGKIIAVFLYRIDSDVSTKEYLERLEILGAVNVNQL